MGTILGEEFDYMFTEEYCEDEKRDKLSGHDNFGYWRTLVSHVSNDGEREFQRKYSNEPAYQHALDIMRKEELCFLDNPECSNGISRFNGTYWEVLNDDKLKGLVYENMSEKDKMQNDNIDGFCNKVSMFIKYEAREAYKTENRFSLKKFEKIQNRVVFKNCVYDAKTGKTHAFNDKLPYYFAVDAEYTEDGKTPHYNKLKRDATGGDKQSMEMFDLMIAYLMIPNRSGKCFFVMANAKDSGKSLLGSFLTNMYVGNRAKSIDLEYLAGRFSFANVNESVLLSCLEMNTDRLNNSAVAHLKRITGENQIRIEAKYKNEQTIPIRFKLLLATNGGLLLPEGMEDPAFYRRVIVIPFIKSTPLDSLINDFDKKLRSEKDAILSKCIRKLKKYIKEDGGIVFPESELSMQMKRKWIGGVCIDDEFIKKAFIYTGDPKSRVANSDVEKVYRFFIEKKRKEKGEVIQTDIKTLKGKILFTYVGAAKSRDRISTLDGKTGKKSLNGIKKIQWNKDFLEKLGFC